MSLVDYKDFSKIKISVGTILTAIENNSLKKPSVILSIDFGPKIGIKKSSAQLQANYKCKNLIHKQILAVINFESKQIGNFISEVLVLGLSDQKGEPTLISPDNKVLDGNMLY